MIVGSMFTGIGGIDLGLEACGLTVGWQCEADSFRRNVLRARFPHVPLYNDARTITPPPVDVLAGGSPCQDFAAHGSGLGLAGERSGLWRAFLRAVELCRPELVFFENVRNILRANGGRDFATVLEGLAGLGFDAEWCVLRAAEAGLPHRRARLFLLAHTSEGRSMVERQAHDDDGRFALRHNAYGCHAFGDAPPPPGDVGALQAWLAEHPGTQPGVRRDLAGIPDRVDRIAALGDAAPPPLVALAWRTLRARITGDTHAHHD